MLAGVDRVLAFDALWQACMYGLVFVPKERGLWYRRALKHGCRKTSQGGLYTYVQ